MMSVLTLEISPKLLERLQAKAAQRQQPVEKVATSLLEEHLTSSEPIEENEREKVRRALKEEGLLSAMSDTLRARIDHSIRHEDVVATLGRAGGKPLSEIILEQRGLKE